MASSLASDISSRLRKNPIKTERYITMTEAMHEAHVKRTRAVVLLPPTSGDLNIPSDEEDVPDDDNDLQEVPCEVELDVETDSSCDEEESPEQIKFTSGRWRKSTTYKESIPDMPTQRLDQQHPELDEMSEY